MIDNPFTMVVMIVAIVMFSVAHMVSSKTRARSLRPSQGSANPALEAEVQRLKDRVAVLERIATDRNHLLEAEIEALRDRPLLSQERAQ